MPLKEHNSGKVERKLPHDHTPEKIQNTTFRNLSHIDLLEIKLYKLFFK